jgi:hypothetical protein
VELDSKIFPSFSVVDILRFGQAMARTNAEPGAKSRARPGLQTNLVENDVDLEI